LGCNRFGSFPFNRAKQIIAASHDGYLIGDGICFHTSDDVYRVTGAPVISNWLQFNIETGKYDVDVERDEAVGFRGGEPRIYIFQLQGPRALELMREVTENKLPDIGFFQIGDLSINGRFATSVASRDGGRTRL